MIIRKLKTLGGVILQNPKAAFSLIKLRLIQKFGSRQMLADFLFTQATGKKINWEHPQDYNDWMNYLSVKTDTTEWSRLADKYAVRDYVKSKGYEDILVPFVGRWDNADDVDFKALPNQFVLKKNNGWGDVFVVKDKSKTSKQAIVSHFKGNNSVGSASGEFHYDRIKPCIIGEALLDVENQDRESCSMIDYKIICIHGRPMYTMTFANRRPGSVETNLYDNDWNDRGDLMGSSPYFAKGEGVPKPKELERMLKIASELSDGFPQVRVDLYIVGGKIYFGELTFTTTAGRITYMTQKLLDELGAAIEKKYMLKNNRK